MFRKETKLIRKPVLMFSGIDRVGRPAQLAKRRDGLWFVRWLIENEFGSHMCRWTATTRPQIVDDNTVVWNFKKFKKVNKIPNYKLPNN